MKMKKFLMASALIAFTTVPAFAQEATDQKIEVAKAEVAKVAAPAVEKIEVNQDGSLSGKVFATINNEEKSVDAKVTLSSEGVVIDAVQSENGVFSFANIAPGSYTLTGSAAGFAGGQAYEVAPYAGTGCSSCNLGLESTNNLVHQSSPVYDAPASACGSCSGSGFGGGGGIGGRGFGGGRGILRSRPLLAAGLIGGVVAIAVDDDDVSADQ